MKPPRQDREPVGLGASVIVAVAGVIVAGLGLVTMRAAFPPMPKPEQPVVLVHADRAVAVAPDRAVISIPTALARPEDGAETADAAPARTVRPRLIRTREHGAERPAIRSSAPKAVLQPPATPAAAPQKIAAASSPDDAKLCKAPSPPETTFKALQPGDILRYDAKFKATTLDIPPPSPPPEEERRLKLSALLADILKN